MAQKISLPELCREAGISDVTGRRYFADYNVFRAPFGHHVFTAEEKPLAMAHIKKSQKRRCRNRYNSTMTSPSSSF